VEKNGWNGCRAIAFRINFGLLILVFSFFLLPVLQAICIMKAVHYPYWSLLNIHIVEACPLCIITFHTRPGQWHLSRRDLN
jgi:hypothetical protein